MAGRIRGFEIETLRGASLGLWFSVVGSLRMQAVATMSSFSKFIAASKVLTPRRL